MLNSKKKLLPMAIAVAACMAAPAVFAQSLGVGVNAGGEKDEIDAERIGAGEIGAQ